LVKYKVKHAHGFTSLGWLNESVGEGWSAGEGVGLAIANCTTRMGAEARKVGWGWVLQRMENGTNKAESFAGSVWLGVGATANGEWNE